MDDTELKRLKDLYKYETIHFKRGINIIAGIDEAGRGPLAGPVVSAAVVLPVLYKDNDYEEWEGLNDSKKLTAKKREGLYKRLVEHLQVHVGIGIVSERIIDKVNILRATHIAMRKALTNLGINPQFLLIDGMIIPKVEIPQQRIINGDSLSMSIAAASIVAKVTRDNIMEEYHKRYPQYAFDRHKGYGTREHFRKLREHGPCKIHRRSFNPVSLMEEIGIE